METTSKYSNQRTAGREHFPLYPKGFIAIRIVQLVFAIIVLGLAAYGLTGLVFDGECLILFTAIATLIACVYYIVAEFGAPALYNYWAVLSLDIFLLIFWLISFALLAAEVAPFANGICYTYSGCYSLSDAQEIYFSILAAASGIGGLEFILFIISVTLHSIMLHRHRKAGLHCVPTSPTTGHAAPVDGGKVATQSQVPQVQQQQPQQTPVSQGYSQQPQHAQAGYAGQPTPDQQFHSVPQQNPQQQVPSPITTQPTGESMQKQPIQHYQVPDQSGQGPYEADSKHGHFQGPYEAHGQTAQQASH